MPSRVLIINPNTTASMTEKIRQAALRVCPADMMLEAVNPKQGPASIEGYYDEARSLAGLLDTMQAQPAADGYIIACFDDTGLDAARCMVDAPVLGIGQSACSVASMLSNKFTVITTLSRSVPVLESNLQRYGLAARCAKVRATDIPVLELEDMTPETMHSMRRVVEVAISEDKSDAIVLGCAGMTDMVDQLSSEFGIPVIDGLSCAVTLAEALVAAGLRTSKAGAYG